MSKISMVPGHDLPLNHFVRETVWIMKGWNFVYEYIDGKKTDNVIAIRYTVVNTENFETLEIKVEGRKPLISEEEFQRKRENRDRIYVEFENPTVKMYWNSRMNSYADSIKADGIRLVETENSIIELIHNTEEE